MTEEDAKQPLVKLTAEQKLRKKLEREQQKAQAASRQAQRIGAQLSKLSRSWDNHIKIVVGATALTHAEGTPEFRDELYRVLNRTLWRDDERESLGLEKLPPEVQEQRKPKRPGGKAKAAE
jgi:hypothetical protein